MALQRGLGAAIMNPRSQAMMDVYRSFRVLTGKDPNCMDYIAAYGESAPAPAAPAQTGYTLQEAIVKGLKDQAYARAKEQAASRPGLEIINGEIVPALDQVGAGFEKKTLFLPQLLMSAEAARPPSRRCRTAWERPAPKSGTCPLCWPPLRETSTTSARTL